MTGGLLWVGFLKAVLQVVLAGGRLGSVVRPVVILGTLGTGPGKRAPVASAVVVHSYVHDRNVGLNRITRILNVAGGALHYGLRGRDRFGIDRTRGLSGILKVAIRRHSHYFFNPTN